MNAVVGSVTVTTRPAEMLPLPSAAPPLGAPTGANDPLAAEAPRVAPVSQSEPVSVTGVPGPPEFVLRVTVGVPSTLNACAAKSPFVFDTTR